MEALDLEPEHTIFACCPTCFALYPPTSGTSSNAYPTHCTHQPHPDGPVCNDLLMKAGQGENGASVPIKTFALQSLSAWIGQLLSRPGIESVLEKGWRRPSQGWSSDIMEATGIREFLGPDGRTPFSVQPDGSLHLVFSLFIDWFNPYGNKAAGKSHSVGAIYMACLNLPENLRYRPENIYLAGLIPGPREPSLEQINHFLKVLVDQLEMLWSPGLYVARTANKRFGRLVRGAVIPLVCDLPALRKVAGFSGHASKNFCSFCRAQKESLNVLSRNQWPRRTWQEHVRIARQWKDAPTAKERDSIYEKEGIRWSELLRLPYWDPTRYALVDGMHNLLLGAIRYHCREVLGIDTRGKPSEGQTLTMHTTQEQSHWLEEAVKAMRAGRKSRLSAVRKGYLVAIAELNNVEPQDGSTVKKAYVEALIARVSLILSLSRPLSLTNFTSSKAIPTLSICLRFLKSLRPISGLSRGLRIGKMSSF